MPETLEALFQQHHTAVQASLATYGQRMERVEKDIDAATNKLAGMISAGGASALGDKAAKKQRRKQSMNALEAFARHRSVAPVQLDEFLAGHADLLPQAAMSVGSNPDGGYLVIPEISEAILTASADVSPMRQLATVVTISTDAYEFLADSSQAEADWVGERDVRNQTTGVQFSKTRIPVNEMYSQPAITQSLLDDSAVDLATYLTGRIGNAFALKEGAAFTAGTGVLQPRGYLNYPMTTDDDFSYTIGTDGTVTVSRNRRWGTVQYYPVGAGDPTDAQLADAIVNAAAQLRAPFRANASWMMSRQLYGRLRTIKDSTGRYLLSTDGRIVDGQPELLAGFPIGGGTQATMFDESLPTATGANALICALGDWKQAYCIVDRVGISILRDPFSAKPYVLFYTVKRVGGGLQHFDALKILKCSTS
jgi:HK97 family phage major capsid protein